MEINYTKVQQKIVTMTHVITRSPDAAETADCTEYDALIDHHLNDNTIPCAFQHKQESKIQ